METCATPAHLAGRYIVDRSIEAFFNVKEY